MKIVFCGYGRAALECFYQLTGSYDVKSSDIMVFTHDTSENEEFVKHLKVNNIRLAYDNINNSLDLIREFHPDYLLSVYYRHIVSIDILNIVNHKAMNLHPSLLPAYKGTKSSVWAILNNEKYTGVSFHYMDSSIDTGRIILKKKITIRKEDTAYSLYHKLISVFSSNFCKAFNLLIDDYDGMEQKGASSYYSRKLPYNGEIKIKDLNIESACRFVRAMYFPPYKGAVFILKDGSKVEVNSIENLHHYIEAS